VPKSFTIFRAREKLDALSGRCGCRRFVERRVERAKWLEGAVRSRRFPELAARVEREDFRSPSCTGEGRWARELSAE
jgi:hypothetical protein